MIIHLILGEIAQHNQISFECMTWHAHLENVLNRLK
jgi:hypothetical protein